MMHLVRTVLHKIAAAREKRQHDEQYRITETMVADLDAIVANMKRAREHVEREGSERRHSALDEYRVPRSYVHPAKWRDAR